MTMTWLNSNQQPQRQKNCPLPKNNPRNTLSQYDFPNGGGSKNMLQDDKGGSGVGEGPKKNDVIYEQSLIKCSFLYD